MPCSTRTWLFQMRISGINLRNPYCPCTTGRLHLASWGEVTTKISLVLVHFGLIKLKPNQNESSISNLLHLLSAPACIPRVEAIWASLVVESKSISKFFLASNFCLTFDLSFLHPERSQGASICPTLRLGHISIRSSHLCSICQRK